MDLVSLLSKAAIADDDIIRVAFEIKLKPKPFAMGDVNLFKISGDGMG